MVNNQNAAYSVEELRKMLLLYITHRKSGYNKESFVDCDYRTIENAIDNHIELQSLKRELEKAERQGLKYWEEIGHDLTKGKLKGNPAAWIFTMKNKYPDKWKDSQQFDHLSGGKPITPIIKFTDD